MQNEQEDIEHILDEFDFHKVQKTVEALNWTWATSDGIPDIGELRRCARRLFKYATDTDSSVHDYSTATGGFEVSRNLYPGVTKRYYSLKFVVSEWNNYE